MTDAAPSVGVLAGQLEYLFEDEPGLRNATDDEVARRLSHDDRFARARERYPILSDDEVREHLGEFDERITPELVRAARARVHDE